MSQLALPLKLDDHAVFDSFWSGGNEAVVAFLIELTAQPGRGGGWIWGAPASGKSHLLQALCERVGNRAVYLPLHSVADLGSEILSGMAQREFICLDDIDAVAGDEAWELGLFQLCNEVADNDSVLVISAATAVRESNFQLPDIESRLAQLPSFHLHTLDDADSVKALQLRAHHRGLELPEETANFLLNRSKRDMSSLYSLLDHLDAEALRAKRKLTVPFVRQVLAASR